MAITNPVFVNGFQKGSSETANIGFGVLLGIETYTRKGVAQLTRDTVKVSGSVVTDLPVFFTQKNQSTIFCQGDTGKVYKSTDTGATWTDISNSGSTGAGRGLIYFQGYVFAFRGGKIDYLASPYGSGNWTTAWKTGLHTTGDSNFPFLFPNDGAVYFANDNSVGKIFFGTASTFNPAGSSGTDYDYDANWEGTSQSGILPSKYIINCISYFPSNYLALGTWSPEDTTTADVILWNPTLSTYETPLTLYSQAGANISGIRQIINRNNVLYATTGGNMCVFRTNGSSFAEVADLSLYSSWRLASGSQGAFRVFLNPYPKAIALLGNKLLTGTTKSIGSHGSYGLFPMGVWTFAFTNEGEQIQLEYPISTDTVLATNPFTIGAIQTVTQGQALIGWQDNTSYGIDLVSLDNFQQAISTVAIESPMLEIGTPLNPSTVSNIEIYMVNNLLIGQTISIYARQLFSDGWTLLQTFDPSIDGIASYYKVTQNPLGASQYFQLRLEMATGGTVTAFTPQIRNVRIS